ncbi:MAG: ATP-binding protein [Myxococcota bacterium]
MLIQRQIYPQIERALARGKSILLLGARQVGKTTLIKAIPSDLSLSLIKPALRQRYEKDPGLLEKEILELRAREQKKLLVFIDEVQKVPELLDIAQDLHDSGIAQFILTGSSARKLRKQKANLLPGRVAVFHLDPLTLQETPMGKQNLEQLLLYGSMPGIVLQTNLIDQNLDLTSYVETYLEDEIRSEAVVRNLSHFSRFLELAASESGHILNFNKLSSEINVANSTIASYYQVLQDCLILERIEPLMVSKTRKKLTRSDKFLFFDLGMRRAAAKEGTALPDKHLGHLFEQWVGLELIRCARFADTPTKIQFWRDPDGPEVDWIITQNNSYTPIEVKYSSAPTEKDAKHLEVFLDEYPSSSKGYIICRTERAYQISKRVTAIPWQETPLLVG